MKINGVYPKDVTVEIEILATELEKIKTAMDDCELTYFGPDRDRMEAQEFFKNKFYPFITKLVMSLKDE